MFAVVTLFAFLWPSVAAYGRGAPFATCLTLFPKHGPTEAQHGPAPFILHLHPTRYHPATIVTVTLKADDFRPFKGIQVKAVRSSGDSESALGTFVKTAPNITQVFTCEGGYKNMVTHTSTMSAETVTEVTLTWKAPDTNVGNIVFVASFVENYDTFWTGVTATLTTAQPETALPPAYTVCQSMVRPSFGACFF
ncbi:hypothetical protein ACOMHN_030478 [Nucella lapillus]